MGKYIQLKDQPPFFLDLTLLVHVRISERIRYLDRAKWSWSQVVRNVILGTDTTVKSKPVLKITCITRPYLSVDQFCFLNMNHKNGGDLRQDWLYSI